MSGRWWVVGSRHRGLGVCAQSCAAWHGGWVRCGRAANTVCAGDSWRVAAGLLVGVLLLPLHTQALGCGLSKAPYTSDPLLLLLLKEMHRVV